MTLICHLIPKHPIACLDDEVKNKLKIIGPCLRSRVRLENKFTLIGRILFCSRVSSFRAPPVSSFLHRLFYGTSLLSLIRESLRPGCTNKDSPLIFLVFKLCCTKLQNHLKDKKDQISTAFETSHLSLF